MQASIYSILPFDAAAGTTIKFAWSGNQIFKNRCIIRRNDSNKIVYDRTVDSFKLEHEIDPSLALLTNGEKYNAFITVFDQSNIESDVQALGVPFLCLAPPKFQFDNLSDGQVLSASAYDFSLFYTQENGELLDSWSISIYTKAHTLLSSSGVKYDTANLSYTFSGFSNKNEYSVRAVGRTVNGFPVDTGYVNLSVTYQIRDVFSLLEPTNMAEIGAIQIRSNIVSSEGHLKNEPAVFIAGEYLDLRKNQITYREGFHFDGNFSIVFLFYGMQPNQDILYFYGETPDILTGTAIYRIGRLGSDEISGCFELKIVSNGIPSVHYSNKIPLPAGTDLIGLCITRENERYDIQIINKGTVPSQNTA